jgi:hypothetical protein
MKVFVSYCRDSESSARALVSDLESLGHDVWFDRELSGGQAWWTQILAAIRDCGLFVFVLHPRALDSVACTRERGYALALGKPVLPVQVADGISVNLLPPDLAQRQIIPYRSGDRAEVLGLARAVAAVPPAAPPPEPLPPPPEVPASYLGTLAQRIDDPAALSYEAQSALLLDLRQAMRDAQSRADADLLLSRLRCRRDLLAAIAEEIDAMRERTQPPSRRSSPSQPAAAPVPVPAPLPAPEAASPPPAVRGRHPAWGFGLVGLALGALGGAVALVGLDRPPGEAALLTGLCGVWGALTGAVSGRERPTLWPIVATATVGFLGWMVLVSGRDVFLAAVAWGVGPGALLGAMLGRLWRRLRAR